MPAAVAAAVLTVLLAPGAAAAPPLPDGVELTFGDGVGPVTRWHVEEAAGRAGEYFAARGAGDLEARLIVVADPDAAVEAWAAARGISERRARRSLRARSGYYAGIAVTGLTVIINDGPSAGATIHEFVHLAQHHLCDCDAQGPRWLSEGAAEWFSLAIEHEWGIDAAQRSPRAENRKIADEWAGTLDACRAGAIPAAGDTCRWAEAPLGDLEGAGAFDIAGGAVGAYDRARVAFQRLVDSTSTGAYLCYLGRQAAGASWRAAFETCFGRTVAAYYAEFDAYRDAGFVASAVPVLRRAL